MLLIIRIAGLDVSHRSTILSLLHSLHAARSPRVMMGLRAQDPVPDWISHVAVIKDGHVTAGPKDDVLHSNNWLKKPSTEEPERAYGHTSDRIPNRKVLVDMKNVTVSYHGRKVSRYLLHRIIGTSCSLCLGSGEHQLDNTRGR